jgi:NAD(P)-dependent dehydrogenase (short-subunit alcohol dehydrogenase family)
VSGVLPSRGGVGESAAFTGRAAAARAYDGSVATTLITGAGKGLGHETARRLSAEGHAVWVSARDRERGAAAAESLGARFVELDVTDNSSVAAARDVVAGAGGLDVLVNNAGIVGPRSRL